MSGRSVGRAGLQISIYGVFIWLTSHMLDHTLMDSEHARGLWCVMLRITHKYCNLHLCDISNAVSCNAGNVPAMYGCSFSSSKGSLRLASLTLIATQPVTGSEWDQQDHLHEGTKEKRVVDTQQGNCIGLVHLSMALRPFAGPWPLFHFLDPIHSR
jgi:hypothetical protein